MASTFLKEELKCSVCLDIYSDPVYLLCGHNFCKECIIRVFNSQEEESSTYTCPECRLVFNEWPDLQKNMKLNNIVEHYFSRKSNENDMVFCTSCIDFTPAAKKCLLCEIFLCEKHLKIHKSEEHGLLDHTSPWKNCSVHKEPLKYYCYEDKAFICMACSVFGDHRGHKVELLHDSYKKKKVELQNMMETLILTIKETEKRDQKLHQQMKNAQEKSNRLKTRVGDMFMDMREQINAMENKCLSDITKQEDQVLLQLSGIIQQIQAEKNELYSQILHIENLLENKDPIGVIEESEVIKSYMCDGYISQKEDNTSINNLDVLVSVTLQSILHSFINGLPDLISKRGFYMEDASDTLLNVNTAAKNIIVTNDMKSVAGCNFEQQHESREIERFSNYQVFSIRSFSSGLYFWELDTSENGDWAVGLAYQSMQRTGQESYLGCNKMSWCLEWDDEYLSVQHNSESEVLAAEKPNGKVGMLLNCDDGLISFFLMTTPVRPLYTFKSNFTEPLYLAISVSNESWVRIIN
ncbi:E3 ubiquitin/ISG15 ligase TRIM25-like [Rhinophrynus dorsalis]